MATQSRKSGEPKGNIVHYKDADGREHWASRTAPEVVKGLESGDLKLIEEVAPDAPTVSRSGDVANSGPAAG